MNEPLYSLAILRLATEAGAYPRLNVSDATAERRSSSCGSTIIIDVTLDANGLVTAYGHELRACALAQATSTLLARRIVGFKVNEVVESRDALQTYLDSKGDPPALWPEWALLTRARDYPARHPSIRLAFEAAAEAVYKAAKRS